MNVEQLQKQLNKTVRLDPPARYLRSVGDWMPIEWNWRVVAVNQAGRRVDLIGGNYSLTLLSDHIREFMHSVEDDFDGFLILKVQVSINGDKVTVEPLMRQL